MRIRRCGSVAAQAAAGSGGDGGGGGGGRQPQSEPCLRMHSSCVLMLLLLLLARTAMARRRGAWRPAEPTKTRCAAARGSAVSILAGSKMLLHGRKEALAGCWCGAGGKRAVQPSAG